MITQKQINKVVQKIIIHYKPEKIVLFGSYAYRNPTEGSDLDLLIVKDTDIPRYKRGREIRKFFRGSKIAVDIIVYTNAEIQKWSNVRTSFITTVMEKGKVLYEC
ncbi:MAG: nucleotidyltransferase domain-containing protein [Bacteroidia bacterium]|nr:nucleotidyltransferase domain-containing protein [Bacteroidia bacterium]